MPEYTLTTNEYKKVLFEESRGKRQSVINETFLRYRRNIILIAGIVFFYYSANVTISGYNAGLLNGMIPLERRWVVKLFLLIFLSYNYFMFRSDLQKIKILFSLKIRPFGDFLNAVAIDVCKKTLNNRMPERAIESLDARDRKEGKTSVLVVTDGNMSEEELAVMNEPESLTTVKGPNKVMFCYSGTIKDEQFYNDHFSVFLKNLTTHEIGQFIIPIWIYWTAMVIGIGGIICDKQFQQFIT